MAAIESAPEPHLIAPQQGKSALLLLLIGSISLELRSTCVFLRSSVTIVQPNAFWLAHQCTSRSSSIAESESNVPVEGGLTWT